jgi:hypothetical protein
MDRRNFLRAMVGGVATAAAVRSFPFRVFSFPTQIELPTQKQIEFLVGTDPLYIGQSISLHGLRWDADTTTAGPYRGIARIASIDAKQRIITLDSIPS